MGRQAQVIISEGSSKDMTSAGMDVNVKSGTSICTRVTRRAIETITSLSEEHDF